MVEETRPMCRIQSVGKDEKECKLGESRSQRCKKKIMKCSIGKTMIKRMYPTEKCEKIPIGIEEKCADMVKLKMKKQKVMKCAFHPKTVCKATQDIECKLVTKKMCNYVNQQ